VIVLDTTALVYAVGDVRSLREPAQLVFQAIERGAVQATTTVEAIQEFVHVRARRRGRRDAAALARAYADLLSPLLHPSEDDLVAGLRLYQRHDELGAFDAVLAAATMSAGGDALVSADRSFAVVRRLPFVDLASSALLELVGRAPDT
jgi:predicted nucleic acid-binding protein